MSRAAPKPPEDVYADPDPRLSQMSVSNLLCAALRRVGLAPEDVAYFTVRPSKLTAVVYKRNTHGRKYLGEDGKAATETWEVNFRP